jgi:hypothetical protein
MIRLLIEISMQRLKKLIQDKELESRLKELFRETDSLQKVYRQWRHKFNESMNTILEKERKSQNWDIFDSDDSTMWRNINCWKKRLISWFGGVRLSRCANLLPHETRKIYFAMIRARKMGMRELTLEQWDELVLLV